MDVSDIIKVLEVYWEEAGSLKKHYKDRTVSPEIMVAIEEYEKRQQALRIAICLLNWIPDHTPMPLEQLRAMDGEPVYIEEDGKPGHWELSEDADDYFTDRFIWDYGKTWAAYPYYPLELRQQHFEVTMKAAINYYGAAAQIDMMFEEMAELQKELCKNNRGQDNVESIAEEIADVRIMLDQMEMLFNCFGLCNAFRTRKLLRLEERMKGDGR